MCACVCVSVCVHARVRSATVFATAAEKDCSPVPPKTVGYGAPPPSLHHRSLAGTLARLATTRAPLPPAPPVFCVKRERKILEFWVADDVIVWEGFPHRHSSVRTTGEKKNEERPFLITHPFAGGARKGPSRVSSGTTVRWCCAAACVCPTRAGGRRRGFLCVGAQLALVSPWRASRSLASAL